jgi:3',5'-cyclic AMP phosphodiesterase CpdA
VPALVDGVVASFSGPGAASCLIITGDLTVNGEAASHQELADRLRPLVKAGVPVYVLPGNHDLNNPAASRFVGDHVEAVAAVSGAEFARIWADFGFSAALSRDPASLSYVVQAAPGVRLLMLDSTVSDQNAALGYSVTGGAIRPATWSWVAQVAAQARASGCRLVAAMHHSLVDHNSVVHDGYTIDDADAVADRLAAFGVSVVLTGHTHVQDVA